MSLRPNVAAPTSVARILTLKLKLGGLGSNPTREILGREQKKLSFKNFVLTFSSRREKKLTDHFFKEGGILGDLNQLQLVAIRILLT